VSSTARHFYWEQVGGMASYRGGHGLAGPLESVARAFTVGRCSWAGAQVLLSAGMQGTWDGRNNRGSEEIWELHEEH